MKKRKCVKLLMGLGIQRNDAAAFVKVFNQIVAKKQVHYFPVIQSSLQPQIPKIQASHRHPIRLRTAFEVSWWEMQTIRLGELKVFVKKKLCSQLAEELMRHGDMIIQEERMGHERIRYTATIDIVPPKEE